MIEKTWLKYENHLLNEGLSQNRMRKLRNMFNVVSRALNLATAKRAQIEDFVNKLNRNEFKTKEGKPYSGNAKRDIKKFLKQYYKFSRGKNEFYPPEVVWLKTKIPREEEAKEKDILTKEQVIKLSNSFEKYDYKILTLCLFDSGFRISEMESVRKKDLTLESIDDKNTKCFFIKCNVSKTFTRTVDLPLFMPELKTYINSEEFKAKLPDDPLFNISYETYNKMLKRYADKLFKLKVSPHGLRHSAATFYADIYSGNVIKLANRFGWSYSAKELATYVRKSKSLPKENAKITFRSELIDIQEKYDTLREDFEEFKKMATPAIKAWLKREIDVKKK